MGLTLRVPHEILPSGATVSNSRLTLEQMDNNFIFLQNIAGNGNISAIPLSFSQSLDLMSSGGVLQGQSYLIQNTNQSLYGTGSAFGFGLGTNVLLVGLDSYNFSKNGWGQFYNPIYLDYNFETSTSFGYPVWDYTGASTYNINDVVIFGGQVWQNITGTYGTNESYFQLDNTNWSLISYTNSNYYNVVWDEIEFDFALDSEFSEGVLGDSGYIVSRYDAINNNLVKMESDTRFFWCDVSPIQMFRWGHRDSQGGVSNCTINSSYFGCLNYVSGQINGVSLNNFSSIFDLQLINNSYFYGINLSNGANISSVTIDNSSVYSIDISNNYLDGYNSNTGIYSCYIKNSLFYSIVLKNNSYFYNIDIIGSEVYKIYMENEGYFYNNSEYNSIYNSEINDITITNGSYIYNIGITDSYFGQITLDNESYIYSDLDYTNYSISGSEMYNISLDNYSYINDFYCYDDSSLYNVSLDTNSYLQYIYIDNSSTSNLVLSNNSSISGNSSGQYGLIYLDNSVFDYFNFQNDSGIILNATGENGPGANFALYEATMTNINLSNNSTFNIADPSFFLIGGANISNINLQNKSIINCGFNSNNSIVVVDSSYIEYIDITNFSSFTDLILTDNSYIRRIELTNDSSFYNNTLGTQSSISDIILTDSDIDNVTITDNSGLYNIQMSDSAIFSNILDNYSYIGDLQISDSIIFLTTLLNGSTINNSELYNSDIGFEEIGNYFLGNCGITNVYMKDSAIFGNNFATNSGIQDTNMIGQSYIGSYYGTNTFSNYSGISNVEMNYSSINDNNLTNGSAITTIKMIDSNSSNSGSPGISYNNFNSSGIYDSLIINSGIYNNTFNDDNNGSGIYDVIMNSAKIYNVYLYDSRLANLELLSNSWIHDSGFSQSGIYSSSLKSSLIYNLNQNIGNGLSDIYMRSSSLHDFVGNQISNLDMFSSEFNFNSTYYDVPQYTQFNSNTIIYKFQLPTFNGSSGQGAVGTVNIGTYSIPSGFYIEKILMDGNSITTHSSSSTINIGMATSIKCGLQHSNIASNFVLVSDIGNGGANGHKSLGDIVVVSITSDAITAGTIYLEITLKNTNYGFNNE